MNRYDQALAQLTDQRERGLDQDVAVHGRPVHLLDDRQRIAELI